MEVCALASGSSGNCFYIGDSESAILVDVGISAKQVVNKLLEVGGNLEKIKAIFITHEHIDHVRGADVLSRKLNIPVYTTSKTAKSLILTDKSLIREIDRNSKVRIGDLIVEAFPKSHGAADPVSYSIYGKKKVSVITDAGYACSNIKSQIADCDFLFIEANHDEQMLDNGPYPVFLKKWISGDEGHLSNKDAATCIKEHATQVERIILSHLSQTNNNPKTALQTFKKILSERKDLAIDIEVSTRECPTKLFKL